VHKTCLRTVCQRLQLIKCERADVRMEGC
jgi:hypothetical protein